MGKSLSNNVIVLKKRKTYFLLIPLLFYALFASFSIIINEDGLGNIKRCLIYIYSPITIFLSLLGINTLRNNKNIKTILNILFVLGIIFSIYVTILYSNPDSYVKNLPPLEKYNVYSDTGASFGIGGIDKTRFTIPGMSSTTYGAILVPIIFIGFYLKKYSLGRSRFLLSCGILFLVVCIFMTVSRGPLVALFAGIIYLVWKKWINLKTVALFFCILLIAFYSFGKLSLLRLALTFMALVPIKSSFLGMETYSLMQDPRFASMGGTLSYILHHPFLGIGISRLIELQSISYGKEHNNYLSISASFGLLTVTFYILFIVLVFMRINKSLKRVRHGMFERDLGIILGAGLLSFIVFLNFSPAEFHFIWVWFGLSAAWLRNCENEFSIDETTTKINIS
jgi:hypothetical protein